MAEKVVVDASAVLAMLLLEKGGDKVADVIGRACISSVNLIEVLTKLIDKGQPASEARRTLAMLQLDVEPVDEALALTAAAMRDRTRSFGLSLGDRVCLSLAQRLNAIAYTADREWKKIDLGIEVVSIR